MDNSGYTPAQTEAPILWRAIGRSVMGASHTRSGKPNQDALGWAPPDGQGTALILAVADGHGSHKCFRSQRGSHLAVTMALAELSRLLESREADDLSAVKRLAQERLPQAIVHHWRQAVDADLAREPLSEAELTGLAAAESESSRQLVAAQPILAYGSTLLTVAVTPAYLLFVQIGDGDILTVSEDGQVTRPVRSDHRLYANETTSLCSPDAWNDFRVTFQANSGTLPALILLSTDGYANSFKNESSFLQVGSDIYQMVVSDGLDQVESHLEQWLTESSHEGSGDDITLGILQRQGFVPRPAPVSSRKVRRPEATLRMPAADAATVALPRPPVAPREVTARQPVSQTPLPQAMPFSASAPPPAMSAALPPFPVPDGMMPAAPLSVPPRRRGRRRLALLVGAFVLAVLAVAAFIGSRLLHALRPHAPVSIRPHSIRPATPRMTVPKLAPMTLPPVNPAKPHHPRRHTHPRLTDKPGDTRQA